MQSENENYDKDLRTLIQRKAISRRKNETKRNNLTTEDWKVINKEYGRLLIRCRGIKSHKVFQNFFASSILSSSNGKIPEASMINIVHDMQYNPLELKLKVVAALLILRDSHRPKKKDEQQLAGTESVSETISDEGEDTESDEEEEEDDDNGDDEGYDD